MQNKEKLTIIIIVTLIIAIIGLLILSMHNDKKIQLDNEYKVYLYTQIKEDEHLLYGFKEKEIVSYIDNPMLKTIELFVALIQNK